MLFVLLVATACNPPSQTIAAPVSLLWTNGPGFRVASVTPTGPGQPGFVALSPEVTGVWFTNVLPATRHYTNQIYLNGSGVAAGDLDEDGWCDLVFGGLGGGTMIFRNLGGSRFENVTTRSGVDLSRLDVTGVVIADLDGDGHLDLLLNTIGQGTHLLKNLGGGQLAPFDNYGVVNSGLGGMSSALADTDGDGRLDLYVANYRVFTARDEPHLGFTIEQQGGRPKVTAYGNRPITDPDLSHRFKFVYRPTPDGGATVFHDEQGEPDAFFHNDSPQRLSAVPWTNGVFLDEHGAALTEPLFDWGLSAMFRDLNGDLAPDLYVANDFATPDRIWINDGHGHFRPAAANAIRQTSLSTMALDIADIDRDGHDDIFTADMLSPDRWRRLVQINQANPNLPLFVDVVTRAQGPRNMLQHNRGDGTYEEIAQMAGLEASEWTWTSIFLDVDLDGFEDLLVANGFERDFMNMDAHRRVRATQARLPRTAPVNARLAANRLYPRLATPNLAFRNLGNLRFTEVSREWGFDIAAVSQGMCLADLDNDGDLDVAINNLNGPATILRNDSSAPRIAVRLRGKGANTRGIGARIEVRGGAIPRQSQEMIAGGRYLSGDDAMRVFAAGTLSNRLTIDVRWRDGQRTAISNVAPNQICEIDETAASLTTPPPNLPRNRRPPLFVDASDHLNHAHPSTPVDDFARQPMLPSRLSALGSGASWLDVTGDGWDDLLLPDGDREDCLIFENDQRGGFLRRTNAAVHVIPSTNAAVTSTTAVGWHESNGNAILFAGIARALLDAADGPTNAAVVQYQVPRAGVIPAPTSISTFENSIGPMALADVDGDGDLDLFVGGRFRPGRWPEPAASDLYLQQPDKTWRRDPSNTNLFASVGLVSGAVFTDLDADGDPDLVLARDWGAIGIFINTHGQFVAADWKLSFAANPKPATQVDRLSQLTGWWTGITAGDFDGDGRLDLIAGNIGRNTSYERFRAKPLRVYFGDFAGDRSVSILECAYDPGLAKYAPLHDVWTLSRTLPWLLARFDSYEKFARVGFEEALGEHVTDARFIEAGWADSTVFINRGDHFEVRRLPREAQVAPAFAVCVADFDGDAKEDVFLSQNFFGVRPEMTRQDAGRGLLLRGDGQGGFSAMPMSESGISIYGEQRGAAVADYDHDGRMDLVVRQNGGRTALLRNAGSQVGWRVRLRGSPGNPQGIGSVIRVGSIGNWGAAREVHAGSGYWSQDSSVTVVFGSPGATHLQVRWPGGKVSEVSIDPTAKEISVAQP